MALSLVPAAAGADAGAGGAVLDEEALHTAAWKLTLGEYAYGQYAGTDLNLRWRPRH